MMQQNQEMTRLTLRLLVTHTLLNIINFLTYFGGLAIIASIGQLYNLPSYDKISRIQD